MTKTLNQIIFVFLHQYQNIFFSNIGNQNISLGKNHNPLPLQVKWSFPKCNPDNLSHISPGNCLHEYYLSVSTIILYRYIQGRV